MDYQEVINTLKDEIKCSCYRNRGYCGICTIYSEMDRDKIIDACKYTISAMQELQEYRKLGTLEEMKLLKDTHLTGAELAELYCAVKKLNEYKKLGTLEQIREAVEKRKEERPIAVLGTFGGEEYECKNCGSPVEYLDDYCRCCGQKQDWERGRKIMKKCELCDCLTGKTIKIKNKKKEMNWRYAEDVR